jgi:hypothetical protein
MFSSFAGASSCLACEAGSISLTGSSSCQRISHPAIVFKLHGSVDTFDEASDRRAKFLSVVVEKLSLPSSVQPLIVAVKPGSVIVDLVFFTHPGSMLSIGDVMIRLRTSFRNGDFASIGAISLAIGDETISPADSSVLSMMAIISISAICFLMVCMFSMLAVKRCFDANKVHPFIADKSRLTHQTNSLHSPAAAVASETAAARFPLAAASSRVSPQDSASDAVFRRVLPKYEDGPSNVFSVKNVVTSSSPLAAPAALSPLEKKRDAPNMRAASSNA